MQLPLFSVLKKSARQKALDHRMIEFPQIAFLDLPST